MSTGPNLVDQTHASKDDEPSDVARGVASEGDETSVLRVRVAELVADNARLTEEVSARDGFLAVAAHELKNALTPVIAHVERLRHRLSIWQPEKIDASLTQIEHATGMFARRATTLLDVSRMTSGKLELERVKVKIGPLADVHR